MAVAVMAFAWRLNSSLESELAAQRVELAQLNGRVASFERSQRSQPDWPSIAAAIEASVVTIEAGDFSGSGWVAHSDTAGSDIVTNFHVVAEAWTAGIATVRVRHQDRTMDGTIVRVDQSDDLAVIHVDERMSMLPAEARRPQIGSTVMAVGSPLGLDGTVTLGIVSGYRSLEGSDYIQFSAPISPGNSGGPVIDAHGRVVAVASAKLVGEGVEALSLGIPVQTVCLKLVACSA